METQQIVESSEYCDGELSILRVDYLSLNPCSVVLNYQILRSSQKSTMTMGDEDENDSFPSKKLNRQPLESSCSMENVTKSGASILPFSSQILLETNVFAFVLIPAALLIAFKLFGEGNVTSIDVTRFTSISIPISLALTVVNDASNWYLMVLEERPVLTKALTTGIIQLIGDYAAQTYEQKQENCTKTNSKKGYDLRRGVSLFADGLLLSGPLLHYCFEWMEEVWPTGVDDDTTIISLATLCHVFVNDYIIDSIYIGLSFVFTGMVEGYSLQQVADIFRKDYIATVRASWITSLGLIPVEILCFGYLSLSFRVLAMNFVDLLWGAIVSFYSHRSRRENSLHDKL